MSEHRRTATARTLALTLALASVMAIAPAAATACSKDDTSYFESFLDTSCMQSLTGTTLDAQGGIRLTTNGAPSSTSWDTDTELDNGVTFESTAFPPVGAGTLARSGAGAAATLGLPTSPMPLQRDAAAVISPPAAAVGDNDNVEDPSVIKVGSTYVMYYAGADEDGSGSAIFQATSTNGIAWTRANGGVAVLIGTASAFDQYGAYGPEVVYDALNVAAPYKMWYSGQGSTFGAIGYATSADGVNWTKYTGGGPAPVPVLDHGAAGAADSFAAADPAVIKDGTTWKMWYTGDDSSKKRIAYATSADGIAWSKGGKVISPEDAGVSANLAFGAFAPTVWKPTATSYRMLLVGRKIVSGSTYQTKILDSSSSDGINWSGPSPAINPSGTSTNFDYSNLDGPDVFEDPGASSPYKAYYAGNTVDANGNFHTRIGHATSNNGNSFGKVNSGPGVNADGSVLDIAALGTAFDARSTSGLSAAVPAGAPGAQKFVGYYAGVRGSDFMPRIGGATSADGSAWTKMTDGTATGGSLLVDGPGGFDAGGHRDPGVMYDSAAASPHRLYFTALSGSGTPTIATAATTEDVNKQPVNSGWSTPSQILDVGSGFDGAGVSHPSVMKDGATYRLYYTGTDSGGAKTIGRTESASATSFAGARTQILTAGSAGSFDAAGVKDPVVWQPGAGDYRMIYTGLELLDGRLIERLGYATSADGLTWAKASPALILNPSLLPFGYDEVGVGAAGVALDGATPHVWFNAADRTGRTRGGHATSSGATTIPDGWATYQLGGPATSVRDFRQITRTSSGTVTLWMSFLQPYSSAGDEFWSDYFPVTVAANPETLNFLLTVRGVRWQARLSNPASTPSLNTVAISHAPVTFSTAGGAVTAAITPPAGLAVAGWNSATINTTMFQPGGGGTGSATARVLDAISGAQLATAPLNTGGNTTINLSAISAAAYPQLRVAFDLTSADGQATPRLNSLQVAYNNAVVPPPPITLTLATSAPSMIFGQPITLAGALAQGGAPLAGQTVTIQHQPIAAPAFATIATAVTDAAGAYSVAVTPDRQTTYKATFAGATTEPAVAVAVAHLVKLKVKRKGTKGYAKGSVGPAHTGKPVQLQQKKGTKWVTVKKLKTTSKSTFAAVVKKLKPKGKYQFRALTAADAEHLAGQSAIFYVDKMKVALTIKRRGRTLAFSGNVKPAHRGKVVVIKVLKGTVWSTFAKVKLSRRSTFALKKKVKPGPYQFRADIKGDRDHWPGQSPIRKVTVP